MILFIKFIFILSANRRIDEENSGLGNVLGIVSNTMGLAL